MNEEELADDGFDAEIRELTIEEALWIAESAATTMGGWA